MTVPIQNRCMIAAAILIGFAIVLPSALAADDLESLEQQAFQAAVERAAPSVVRIETIGGLERMGKLLFGAGPTTGLIVDPDGYIISSAFNFLRRPDSILVQLPGGGGRKPAKLVATDHSRKLVLLKIEVEQPLPVPQPAPKSEMRVGQWAIAVGRTFDGNQPNMSVGILSAVNRVWGRAIQTDAAVSPSNYGGPLLDIRGRVLGVIVPLSPRSNKEIAGMEWYDSGIGFAVPAEDIQRVLPRLKKGEDLHAGIIGINFRAANPSTGEPVIGACVPGSPAYKAGIKTGDRIVEIDGREITFAAGVKQALGRCYAGDTIRMVVVRDKKRIEHRLTLVAKLPPYEYPMLGILPMRELGGEATSTADTKTETKAKAETKAKDPPAGVTVRWVYPEGPAAKAGIKPGDVLVSLADKPIEGAEQLRRQIVNFLPGEEVQLDARRGGKTHKFKVRLGRLPENLPPEALPPAHADVTPDEGKQPKRGTVKLEVAEMENEAWAYVPQDYDPAVPHGVVISLHAPGEFDREEMFARWKPYCERHDLILLAPRSLDPARWHPDEEAVVAKLLAQIVRTYTIDRTRIVMHGYEGGGTLAYRVAFRHRNLVRAVATVNAPMRVQPPTGDPVHRLAFIFATAEKSRFARVIEKNIATLRKMKYPVAVIHLGEQPRYLTDDEFTQFVRWIDTLDRI
jgi:serine protease Do